MRLVRLTLDGLIYASSMVLLDSARQKVPVPRDRPRIAYRSASHLFIYTRDQVPETTPTSCGAD